MSVGQLQPPLIRTRRLFGEGFFTSVAAFPTPPKRTLKTKRNLSVSPGPSPPLYKKNRKKTNKQKEKLKKKLGFLFWRSVTVLSRFLRACRMVRLNIYFLFFSFVYFFSPCSKDQFAVLWISPAVVMRSLQINAAWPVEAFIPFKCGLSKYIDISNQSTNEIYPPKSQIDNQKNGRTSISNRPEPTEATNRLDYQPLFGKMSPHSSPPEGGGGEDQDRTRETAEIEPRQRTPSK